MSENLVICKKSIKQRLMLKKGLVQQDASILIIYMECLYLN